MAGKLHSYTRFILHSSTV